MYHGTLCTMEHLVPWHMYHETFRTMEHYFHTMEFRVFQSENMRFSDLSLKTDRDINNH